MRVLEAKLSIPPLYEKMLIREDLINKIEKSIDKKLTLISAPAGYGKTTLISQWIDQSKHSAGWLSLDRYDDEPSTFLLYFISAINRIFPGTGESSLSLLRSVPLDINNTMINLINEISSAPDILDDLGKHVLIIDNYHFINNNRIHQILSWIMNYLPDSLHLIIITRHYPELSIAKLRVQNQLNEINIEDVRFSLDETRFLISKILEKKIKTEDIDLIQNKTDGWITGIRLITSVLHLSQTTEDQLEGYSEHRNRGIINYLDDEVFQLQTREIQEFLLSTSVLEYMSADLCNAVTDRNDSKFLLEQLEKSNIFLKAMDSEHNWYQYQALFLDLLRYKFEQSKSDEKKNLHLRASIWYENNNQITKAVEHAIISEDDERIDYLFKSKQIKKMSFKGELELLFTWRNIIPERVLRLHPEIAITYAWAYLFSGEISLAFRYLREALDTLGIKEIDMLSLRISKEKTRPELLAEIAAIYAGIAIQRNEIEKAIEMAKYSLDNLPLEFISIRSTILAMLGDAYRMQDKFDMASEVYKENISLAQKSGDDLVLMQEMVDLAQILISKGKLREAEYYFQRVISSGDQYQTLFYPVIQANLHLGKIYIEWNLMELGKKHIKEAILLSRNGGYSNVQMMSYFELSDVFFAEGQKDNAIKSFDQALAMCRVLKDNAAEDYITWQLIKRDLRVGDIRRANENINRIGLNIEGEIDFAKETKYMIWLEVMLITSNSNEKIMLQLINKLENNAKINGKIKSYLKIELLKTRLYAKMKKTDESIKILESTLSIAHENGFFRIIIDDLKNNKELLKKIASEKNSVSSFASQLLANMEEMPVYYEEKLIESLTERELEILQLVKDGLSNKDISQKLNVSLSTVKTHIYHIFDKLGVKNRIQAMIVAEKI